MSRAAPVAVSIICLLLVSAQSVHAGQLHVTFLDLAIVAQGAGIALVATVLSVKRGGEGNNVTVRVDEIRIAAQADGDTGIVPTEDASYRIGKQYDFSIYEGIEWTDPHVSPADIRVRGSLPLEKARAGDQVVLVRGHFGWEILPQNPEMERKLQVFFAEDGIRRYVENTDTTQLKDDLSDADLRSLARKTLIDRNALTPDAVVQAAFRMVRPYDMFVEHFEPLNHEERNAFLGAASELLSIDPHPNTIRDLIEVVDRCSNTGEYREAKSKLLTTLVKSSTSAHDKEQADWFVQRFSDWLPREQRVLLDDRSEGEFLDWLSTEDDQEREAALAVAKQMTGQRRAELLSRLLWGDRVREDDQTYGETVASLAVLTPEAGPILTPNLRNDRAWKAAATGLTAIGRPAVPSLLSLIDDVKNTEIRARAVLVLQLIGPQAGDAVPKLVSLLDEPALMSNAIAALGGIGPAADAAVSALEKASKGARRRIRLEIVKALESIGTPGALEAARRCRR